MSIAGNLRTMVLADLLQWLSASGKTGTLVIDGPEYTKRLYFRQGTVVAVASDNPREMLGYYLVGWGHLSEEELEYVVGMQGHFSVMLGELVVRMDLVTRQDLDRVLLVKTQETIYDLLLWDEANFRFLEGALPDRDFLEITLPVESILVEGFRQREERRQIVQVIASSGCVPALVAVPPTDLEQIEQNILIRVDGQRCIARIALDCRVPEFTVLRLVHRFLLEGVMELYPPSEEESAMPGASDAPWRDLVAEIDDRIGRQRLLDALELILELKERYRDRSDAWELAAIKEQEVADRLDRGPLTPATVLEPAIALDELMKLECTPAEGFVLSRVNGTYTVDEVLRQLPGSMLFNRAVLLNLLRQDLVKLRQVTSIRRFKSPPGLDEQIELPETLDEPGT